MLSMRLYCLSAVPVNLNLPRSVRYPYTAQGRVYFFNRAVLVEEQAIDPDGSVLVKMRRQIIVMIEKVPLIFEFND